ncbi:hypothetical protein Glove_413g5 [Diversispora epigaea]|uniref:Uncharacterized protein n=1 Tax=Diversispora epigaea TaxID=1348612 RepID=A0A397H1R1_9GLOM|nr:hypothetical protein Glove_413g5 [Diversispora epigaea]
MGIISHSDRHERRLEKVRINNINSTERLIFESNIWNLAVIDYIDFKERTFSYRNIYDVTRGKSPLIFKRNFNVESLYKKILIEIQSENSYSPPKVVILEVGNAPNEDSSIFEACEIYGIFDLAITLDVRFLDKLESVVDYRLTVRVLELIWVVVGIAIHIYLKKTNKKIEDIVNDDRDTHRLEIRTGNFDLQYNCLTSFAPLFSIAEKSNYTCSIVHFISIIAQYSQLQQTLRHSASINLTKKNHYYAYDETLETLGVKFIKQNVTGNVINEENLKQQIKSVQLKREHIDLLFAEYIDNHVKAKNNHAITSWKDAIWKLADDLIEVFEMENFLEHELFKKFKPK